MDEEKKESATNSSNHPLGPIYDRIHISVKALDAIIIGGILLIVLLILIGSR